MNGERNRRHLTDDPSCNISGAALEDVSHLFRGCVEAQALWPRLIKDKLNEFLLMESKHHTGSCSVLETELWGMYKRLTTAWSLGYARVVVELDCQDVYDMIVHGNP
ncbi:hypothetical protein V6N12_048491 [Hibiscus sabdariffa]|uniref:RNase H type-1 domain-containing protein n=1 Tax=Hibiscus sabdariffa TaxID=183260 RepID=A0ABR2EHG2_9ROSI